MAKLRPVPIVIIAFYCFFLGLLFLSVTANTVFGNNDVLSSTDFYVWLPAAAYITFSVVSVAVGIGILFYNQLCWKILFFNLIIGISTIASFLMVVLIFLCLDPNLFFQYYQAIRITFITWFLFLFIIFSGVIILYLLTLEETLANFGAMGELIEPF